MFSPWLWQECASESDGKYVKVKLYLVVPRTLSIGSHAKKQMPEFNKFQQIEMKKSNK